MHQIKEGKGSFRVCVDITRNNWILAHLRIREIMSIYHWTYQFLSQHLWVLPLYWEIEIDQHYLSILQICPRFHFHIYKTMSFLYALKTLVPERVYFPRQDIESCQLPLLYGHPTLLLPPHLEAHWISLYCYLFYSHQKKHMLSHHLTLWLNLTLDLLWLNTLHTQ